MSDDSQDWQAKMDIFKVLVQKLSIFKSKSALLVPIIIGLVGGLLLIPTQLMSSKLKKQIKSESVSTIGKSIQSLRRETISSEQWKKEQERHLDYAKDVNEIALLAKRSTQRELLSYKMFPEPQDKSQFTFLEFSKRYCDALRALVTGINGRDCPTETELEKALKKSSGRSGMGDRNQSTDFYTGFLTRSSGTLYGERGDVEDTIVDEICRQRAESASVYARQVDLSGYRFWLDYKYDSGIKEAVEDCWYCQLAYWIIEDVIDTIGTMNSEAGSNSVLASPVKRLIGIYFDLGVGGIVSSYGGQASSVKGMPKKINADRPIYILSLEEAVINPYTGRHCNNDIDIVHFRIVVIVSAKEVLPFMQQLCSAKEHKFAGFYGNEQEQIYKHNQITILESKISSIDREDETHKLFRYGDEAVVELDLVCEYIFKKAGYEEIKPASIKEIQKPEGKTEKKGAGRGKR